MKTLKIAAAALLALGLSTAVYADMHKCGGGMGMKGKMNMAGDFETQKSMMLKHLDKMKGCVEASKSSDELKACKQNMMQKMQKMKSMKMGQKSMKCAAGKCGGK